MPAGISDSDRHFRMRSSLENSIILAGDCKQTPKAIRSESVDLVVSSPPYGMQRKYGDTLKKRQSLEDYLSDMHPILNELCRILKETGSLCWQVGNFILKSATSNSEKTRIIAAQFAKTSRATLSPCQTDLLV